jgi:hypothetical protein
MLTWGCDSYPISTDSPWSYFPKIHAATGESKSQTDVHRAIKKPHQHLPPPRQYVAATRPKPFSEDAFNLSGDDPLPPSEFEAGFQPDHAVLSGGFFSFHFGVRSGERQ